LQNLDKKTVESFGDEWSKFDQSGMSEEEGKEIFDKYFSIFPWNILPKNSTGFDMGCGSGRWAYFVASRVSHLHCVDPSNAINVARIKLKNFKNLEFHQSSLDTVEINEQSQDFGYSLGVLHHVPDTQKAIKSCSKLLKKGAPFLLYIYYAFDNRPWWFFWLWKVTDILRRFISRLSPKLKILLTDLIAYLIYFPVARTYKILEKLKINTRKLPLSFYKDQSLYTMRTDSRDRFGTILEKRFSKSEIKEMMENADLVDIKFSANEPFWCAVGIKK
tara:strand:+ start:1815 stop:2639 length:825 start_codon:yes stop_codon:yes gene_type:complete